MKALHRRAAIVYGIVAVLAIWNAFNPKQTSSISLRTPASIISLSDNK